MNELRLNQPRCFIELCPDGEHVIVGCGAGVEYLPVSMLLSDRSPIRVLNVFSQLHYSGSSPDCYARGVRFFPDNKNVVLVFSYSAVAVVSLQELERGGTVCSDRVLEMAEHIRDIAIVKTHHVVLLFESHLTIGILRLMNKMKLDYIEMRHYPSQAGVSIVCGRIAVLNASQGLFICFSILSTNQLRSYNCIGDGANVHIIDVDLQQLLPQEIECTGAGLAVNVSPSRFDVCAVYARDGESSGYVISYGVDRSSEKFNRFYESVSSFKCPSETDLPAWCPRRSNVLIFASIAFISVGCDLFGVPVCENRDDVPEYLPICSTDDPISCVSTNPEVGSVVIGYLSGGLMEMTWDKFTSQCAEADLFDPVGTPMSLIMKIPAGCSVDVLRFHNSHTLHFVSYTGRTLFAQSLLANSPNVSHVEILSSPCQPGCSSIEVSHSVRLGYVSRTENNRVFHYEEGFDSAPKEIKLPLEVVNKKILAVVLLGTDILIQDDEFNLFIALSRDTDSTPDLEECVALPCKPALTEKMKKAIRVKRAVGWSHIVVLTEGGKIMHIAYRTRMTRAMDKLSSLFNFGQSPKYDVESAEWDVVEAVDMIITPDKLLMCVTEFGELRTIPIANSVGGLDCLPLSSSRVTIWQLSHYRRPLQLYHSTDGHTFILSLLDSRTTSFVEVWSVSGRCRVGVVEQPLEWAGMGTEIMRHSLAVRGHYVQVAIGLASGESESAVMYARFLRHMICSFPITPFPLTLPLHNISQLELPYVISRQGSFLGLHFDTLMTGYHVMRIPLHAGCGEVVCCVVWEAGDDVTVYHAELGSTILDLTRFSEKALRGEEESVSSSMSLDGPIRAVFASSPDAAEKVIITDQAICSLIGDQLDWTNLPVNEVKQALEVSDFRLLRSCFIVLDEEGGLWMSGFRDKSTESMKRLTWTRLHPDSHVSCVESTENDLLDEQCLAPARLAIGDSTGLVRICEMKEDGSSMRVRSKIRHHSAPIKALAVIGGCDLVGSIDEAFPYAVIHAMDSKSSKGEWKYSVLLRIAMSSPPSVSHYSFRLTSVSLSVVSVTVWGGMEERGMCECESSRFASRLKEARKKQYDRHIKYTVTDEN